MARRYTLPDEFFWTADEEELVIDAEKINDAEAAGRLLLTVAECAAMLGVSRSTIMRLLARDELASVKVLRCRRVPVAALVDFVAKLSEGR